MRIHVIQTGTVAVRPNQRQGRGTDLLRLVNTLTDHRWTEPLPIYVWVIEHPEGIIVIDTGETARTKEPGYFPRWHPYFRWGLRESVWPHEEVGPQLEAIGIPPDEVRWVILTHFHTDHVGGLYNFPRAEILVSRRAYELASGFMGQVRGFLPQHWPAWFAPTLVELAPEPLRPFPDSFRLTQAGDVILVPTPGHTEAHLSVVLETADMTYFFAGDASYTQQLMLDRQIDGVAANGQTARQTLERIGQFVRERPTIYLPSHDPASRYRLLNQVVAMPAEVAEAAED